MPKTVKIGQCFTELFTKWKLHVFLLRHEVWAYEWGLPWQVFWYDMTSRMSRILGEKNQELFKDLQVPFSDLFLRYLSYHVTLDIYSIIWKKLSHHDHNNSEQLKFNNIQDRLSPNSKTSKTQFCFQELCRA